MHKITGMTWKLKVTYQNKNGSYHSNNNVDDFVL